MPRFLLLAILATAVGLAHAEIKTEPEVQPGTPAPLQAKTFRLPPARIAATRLPQFMVPKAQAALPGVPTQVGHGRVVAEFESAQAATESLAWESTASGGLKAALSVTSPGAAATRLGLRIEAAPEGALFRFYPPNGEAPFEVPYTEIAQQLRAGATSAKANAIYWSPVVDGETQVVEIELPAGHAASELRIAVPSASHLTTSADSGFAIAKAAAGCNLDAMCYQASWATESNAVARIIYTDGGSSYVCSGTLLADRDTSTAIPYFLTAHHCVTTQAMASTVLSYWFYRSTACNTGVRGNYVTRTGGATLLYSTATTDTSFMRLNSAPPAGVTYAGWMVGSSGAAQGSAVTSLHHPTGDLLKISFGNVNGFRICTPTSNDGFSCNSAPSTSATFYRVQWRQGITESGSSGSGLFLDSSRYLVGQLYGGSGSCSSSAPTDYYGRFDTAYNGGLNQWLGSSSTPSTPAVVPEFDYSDLWWNASESGWGLSITQHSSGVFAAWYVYDGGGNPTWVVMPGGTWTDNHTFVGDVYAAIGPDPRGSFDPARVTRTKVGTATLSFTARDRGTLTYTVNGQPGTKSIVRQVFGAVDNSPVGNYADLWWNANESGWGLSINQQYRSLFAVWYAYRDDGNPVWYVMPDGAWTSADTFSGTVYRANAAPRAFFGTSFDPSGVTRTAVGSMSLRFTGSAAATMSYTVDGISGTKALTRQPF